jgi:hypothetical protein
MNLIDKVKIKDGRLIKVWDTNSSKIDNATPLYISVWVEDADGTNARCLLFTPTEIERAEHRTIYNMKDLIEKTTY